MSADDDAGATTTVAPWKGRITAALLLALPLLAGIALALRWSRANEDAYIAVSQTIAILLIAVALEFFSDSSIFRGRTDSILTYSLLAVSWSGIFASMHAILEGAGTSWTAGVSAGGVVAVCILVGLTLVTRLSSTPNSSNFAVVGVIVFPAIVFLVIL